DDLLVPRVILALHIVKQLATLAHHLEQPTTRVVVLLMGLEVIGQRVDALCEDRDLDFRRTCITRLGRVVLNEFLLALGRQRHRSSFLDMKGGPSAPYE